MKRAFVTGSEGFLGKHLCKRLEADGVEVVRYDPILTQGKRMPLDEMKTCGFVFHLAAVASVREIAGSSIWETNVDFTRHVIFEMARRDIKEIAFVSSSAVYASPVVVPTPEDCPFPIQTSIYGASKLAAEGMIQAHCSAHGVKSYIFRPVPILGEHYRRGHIFDFVKQLLAHPSYMEILGDGLARKSYIYAGDVVDGMLHVIRSGVTGAYNLGLPTAHTIMDSIGWIRETMGVTPEIRHVGKTWAGDNPYLLLDTHKIRSLDWTPKVGAKDGVQRTVKWMLENREIFK